MSSVQRFSMQAFRFLSQHRFVYLHCDLVVCHRYDSNSTCSRSTSCSQRNRRDVDEKSDDGSKVYPLSFGPIMEKKETSNSNDDQGKAHSTEQLTTPRHSTAHHNTPHHTTPHHTTPHHTTPHHTTPHHTTPHHTTPHHTTPHHTTPHHTTPHHTTPHHTHHTTPHHTTPHHTTPHHTTPHHTTPHHNIILEFNKRI